MIQWKQAAMVLGLLLLTGCSIDTIKSILGQDSSQFKAITSADGDFQLNVPQNWKEETELNDVASIQSSNRLQEMYVIVIDESKEDIDESMTLEEYSKLTRNALMKAADSAVIEGPRELTVNKTPFLQYEIQGTVEKIKISYLHTVVETPKHFHQVLAWTLKSKWEKNQAMLKKVVESFRGVQKETSP